MNDQPLSLIKTMAARYEMDPVKFSETVKAMCVPQSASNEMYAAFLMTANKYDLNPITHEIYAMVKGGKLSVIVGVDGWMALINRRPEFDGMEFGDHMDKGRLMAITCRIFRKDRAHPIEVTEYLAECDQGTEPWKRWPARMLRHKAAIQCARYAFAISGIIDPDEFDRFGDKPLKVAVDNSSETVARLPQKSSIPDIPTIPDMGFSTAPRQATAPVPRKDTAQRSFPGPAPSSDPIPSVKEWDLIDGATIDDDGVILEADPRPATPGLMSEWAVRLAQASYNEGVNIIEKEVYPARERGQITEEQEQELTSLVLDKGGWRGNAQGQ